MYFETAPFHHFKEPGSGDTPRLPKDCLTLWDLLKSAFFHCFDEISGVQLHAEAVGMELVYVILRKVRNQGETVDYLYIRILPGDFFHIIAEADKHIVGFGMIASPERGYAKNGRITVYVFETFVVFFHVIHCFRAELVRAHGNDDLRRRLRNQF